MLSGDNTDRQLLEVVLMPVAVLVLVVQVVALVLVLLVEVLVPVMVPGADIARFFACQGTGILCGLDGHSIGR